jgi:hypothetical protein
VGRPKLIKVDVTDGRGLGGAKNKTVSVQTRIPDIRAYKGTPGFAYLLLAANPDTPVSVLRTILDAIGQPYPKTWLYKRRALFEVPTLPPGTDGRIVAFMRANLDQPVRKSVAMLRKQGVKCGVAMAYRIWMAISYSSSME